MPVFSRQHRSSGFTLMEAMVVVAIIGLTAALAAPGLMTAMAQRRMSEAQGNLVRIGARARSEAMAYGRAHLLRYDPSSTAFSRNYGQFQLWRGQVNLCTANDWPTIVTGTCDTNPNCLEQLDMGYYAGTTNRVRVRMTGATRADICFQPNGQMRVSNNGAAFSRRAPGSNGQAARFYFRRLTGNSDAGDVLRYVVFPMGGTPRIRR